MKSNLILYLLKTLQKKKNRTFKTRDNRELFYKKDMGILASGGFSFDLSKRVLDLETKNLIN